MEEVSNTLKNTWCGWVSGFFLQSLLVLHKKIVLGTIHKIFDNKELTISVRLGIIALIPKGYKDKKYISNWRPLKFYPQPWLPD